MNLSEIKKNLGNHAARLIERDMIVGLGTGSTAECFIQSLIHRVKEEDLRIQAVASSEKSKQLASAGGIQVVDLNEVSRVDITIDGADEIDPEKRLIKGAGGALLREKILAAASREMVVIADESKLVDELGKTKLPVEILPYGALMTEKHIQHLGWQGSWRTASSTGAKIRVFGEDLFVTDQGNVILDLVFAKPPHKPEQVHEALLQIPGVIETGFFFRLASRIFVGFFDGRIQEFS